MAWNNNIRSRIVEFKRNDFEFIVIMLAYMAVGVFYHIANRYDLNVEIREFSVLIWTVIFITFMVWIALRYVKDADNLHEIGEMFGFAFNLKALILTCASIVLMLFATTENTEVYGFKAYTMIPLMVFMEEMVFRATLIFWIRDKLRKFESKNFFAVATPALIFAVGHLPDTSIPLLIGLFISALLFGALYLWSGSIIFGLILHAYANGGYVAAKWVLIVYSIFAVLFNLSKIPARS